MYKILNFFMILVIIFFIVNTYFYYFSNKNIRKNNFNRTNIEQLLQEKTKDVPILYNDTENVIEFNNSLKNENENNKKRSFWNLLNSR